MVCASPPFALRREVIENASKGHCMACWVVVGDKQKYMAEVIWCQIHGWSKAQLFGGYRESHCGVPGDAIILGQKLFSRISHLAGFPIEHLSNLFLGQVSNLLDGKSEIGEHQTPRFSAVCGVLNV
jgi:hypothetical protein